MKSSELPIEKNLLFNLLWFKGSVLFASVVLIALSYSIFDLTLNLYVIGLSLGLGAGFFVLGYLRTIWSKPIRRVDVMLFISSDIVLISLLVHFTGGTANPFSSFILVPLALSMVLLSLKESAFLLVVSAAIYGLWTLNMDEHAHHHMSFEMHLYGMWANYLVSAILLFLFISYVMNRLRDKEQQLRLTREKILKDEHLVGIATLTANTAHSMGTPLSTMQILLEDVKRGEDLTDTSLVLLKDQVEVCRQYLLGLVRAAKTNKIMDYEFIEPSRLVANLRQHVNLLFPERPVEFVDTAPLDGIQVKYSQTLFFAIANILDNAIQAAEKQVTVTTAVEGERFKLVICDDGPGFKSEDLYAIDQPFLSDGASGMGVGLFLTNSTIEQAGGSIQIQDLEPHGTIFTISISLKDTVPDAH